MHILKILFKSGGITKIFTKILIGLAHTKKLLEYIKAETSKLENSYKIQPYIESVYNFLNTMEAAFIAIAKIISPISIEKSTITVSDMTLNETLNSLKKITNETVSYTAKL